MPQDYEFSVDWFSSHWPNWKRLTEGTLVSKILEIGSFEGRSTCAMIEEFAAKSPVQIFCVDTWAGGVEHGQFDMGAVEARFDRNVVIARNRAGHAVAIEKYKGVSSQRLAELLAGGHGASFDLVFLDGSHQAPDVLTDLVLGYYLCKVGGFIICDDYLWSLEPAGQQDPLNMPKAAIDAFSTIFMRKMKQIGMPLYQVYFRKMS